MPSLDSRTREEGRKRAATAKDIFVWAGDYEHHLIAYGFASELHSARMILENTNATHAIDVLVPDCTNIGELLPQSDKQFDRKTDVLRSFVVRDRIVQEGVPRRENIIRDLLRLVPFWIALQSQNSIGTQGVSI